MSDSDNDSITVSDTEQDNKAEQVLFDEELPSIFKGTRSRPGGNYVAPIQLHNTVFRCLEYPNGVFIDSQGRPDPNHRLTGSLGPVSSVSARAARLAQLADEDDDVHSNRAFRVLGSHSVLPVTASSSSYRVSDESESLGDDDEDDDDEDDYEDGEEEGEDVDDGEEEYEVSEDEEEEEDDDEEYEVDEDEVSDVEEEEEEEDSEEERIRMRKQKRAQRQGSSGSADQDEDENEYEIEPALPGGSRRGKAPKMSFLDELKEGAAAISAAAERERRLREQSSLVSSVTAKLQDWEEEFEKIAKQRKRAKLEAIKMKINPTLVCDNPICLIDFTRGNRRHTVAMDLSSRTIPFEGQTYSDMASLVSALDVYFQG